MKEAIVIFIALLILLTIVSVFGGSIRYTPSPPQSVQTFVPGSSSKMLGPSSSSAALGAPAAAPPPSPAAMSASSSAMPMHASSSAPASVPGGSTAVVDNFASF